VLDPTGKEVAFIPTGPSQPGAKAPRGIPANCCFGLGAESKLLYVTVDTSLYRIPLKVEGWQPTWEK
jgi:sugar lactone lactonase YvrE